MGTTLVLAHIQARDPVAYLKSCKDDGFYVVAVEQGEGAMSPDDTFWRRLPEQTVLVLGNEGAGLPDSLLDWADARLEIPMQRSGISLNVSVAGAIAMSRLWG